MEKVLDLRMPGVQELGREELKEVDGGFVWIAVISAGIYLYNNWDDFKAGFEEGFNQK